MSINEIPFQRCICGVFFVALTCYQFLFWLFLLGHFLNVGKGSIGWKQGFFETTGSIVHKRSIDGSYSSWTEYCAGVEGVYGDTKDLIDASAPSIIFGDLSKCFGSKPEAEKEEPGLLARNKGIFKCWATTEKDFCGLFSSHLRLKKKKPTVDAFPATMLLAALLLSTFFLRLFVFFALVIRCDIHVFIFSD